MTSCTPAAAGGAAPPALTWSRTRRRPATRAGRRVVLGALRYATGTAFTRSQTKSLWSKLRTTLLPLVPEFPWSSTTIHTSS